MPNQNYENMCDKALVSEQQDNRESNLVRDELKKRMGELTKQRDDALFEEFSSLTLNRFQKVNEKRCEAAFKHTVSTWSINDWATATGGEIGEAIQELGKLLTFLDTAKKIKRLEDHPYNDEELVRLLDQFAEELADIITYADLTMTRIRRNTEVELVKKFNKVSDKRGSNIKL
jgi:NTP pyrophosphatase (non-canonical NTP hydrolase)